MKKFAIAAAIALLTACGGEGDYPAELEEYHRTVEAIYKKAGECRCADPIKEPGYFSTEELNILLEHALDNGDVNLATRVQAELDSRA